MKYYALFPKPAANKKRKKMNGWKDKPNRYCYYCGTPYAERHEVYNGPNRQISIDFGFQVDLCHSCHEAWHRQDKAIWQERKLEWQQKFQYEYEQELIAEGNTKEQARRCWFGLIGKNYLDE